MKVFGTLVVLSGIACMSCASDPPWRGLKIEELPSYGDKKLVFSLDDREISRMAREFGGINAGAARRYAEEELRRRGMCVRGFRGPDVVLGQQGPPYSFSFFTIYCNEPADVKANKTLERTVAHRGRTVRAVALCARAGAWWRSWPAVQRNR